MVQTPFFTMPCTRQLYARVFYFLFSATFGCAEAPEQKGGVQPFVQWLRKRSLYVFNHGCSEKMEPNRHKKRRPWQTGVSL